MFEFRVDNAPWNKVGTQAHLETESGVEYFFDFDPACIGKRLCIYTHSALDGVMMGNTLTIYDGNQLKFYSVNC
jgi:hypothetical protein